MYQLIPCVILFNILLPPPCGSPKLALSIKFSDLNLEDFFLTHARYLTHTSHISVWLLLFGVKSGNYATFYHTFFSPSFSASLSLSSLNTSELLDPEFLDTYRPRIAGKFTGFYNVISQKKRVAPNTAVRN